MKGDVREDNGIVHVSIKPFGASPSIPPAAAIPPPCSNDAPRAHAPVADFQLPPCDFGDSPSCRFTPSTSHRPITTYTHKSIRLGQWGWASCIRVLWYNSAFQWAADRERVRPHPPNVLRFPPPRVEEDPHPPWVFQEPLATGQDMHPTSE